MGKVWMVWNSFGWFMMFGFSSRWGWFRVGWKGSGIRRIHWGDGVGWALGWVGMVSDRRECFAIGGDSLGLVGIVLDGWG